MYDGPHQALQAIVTARLLGWGKTGLLAWWSWIRERLQPLCSQHWGRLPSHRRTWLCPRRVVDGPAWWVTVERHTGHTKRSWVERDRPGVRLLSIKRNLNSTEPHHFQSFTPARPIIMFYFFFFRCFVAMRVFNVNWKKQHLTVSYFRKHGYQKHRSCEMCHKSHRKICCVFHCIIYSIRQILFSYFIYFHTFLIFTMCNRMHIWLTPTIKQQNGLFQQNALNESLQKHTFTVFKKLSPNATSERFWFSTIP